MIVRAIQCLSLLVSHCSLIVEALWTSLALEHLGFNVYQFFTVINVIQCARGAFKVYPCVTDVWVLEFYPHQIKIFNK
jgi:hypothetical protein